MLEIAERARKLAAAALLVDPLRAPSGLARRPDAVHGRGRGAGRLRSAALLRASRRCAGVGHDRGVARAEDQHAADRVRVGHDRRRRA